MVFYSSLYDEVEGLLKKKYKLIGSTSFKVKSKTKDNVKLEFNAKRKNEKQDVTGGFKFSQNFKKDDLELELDSNISNDGAINADLKLTGITDGLELKSDFLLLQSVDSDKDPIADESEEKKKVRNRGGFTVSFKNEKQNFGVNFNLRKKRLNAPVVTFDVAKQVHDNCALGVKLSAPLKKISSEAKYQKFLDTDLSARLSSDDVTVEGSLTDAGRKTSLGIVSKVNDELTVGAEFTHSKGIKFPWCFKGVKSDDEVVVDEKKKTYGFTFGFSLKGENNTELSAKVNQDAVASFAYSFDLKENLRTGVAVETDISKIGQGSKLGVSFTYSE